MTRLTAEWIENMEAEMNQYNKILKDKISVDLCQLAGICCNISPEEMEQAKKVLRIASVPITQGKGIINKFSQSVAAITRSMGFDSFVTEHTDVNGIYDAVKEKADVVFFADDDRYLALNLKTGEYGENNFATALGYITALDILMDKNNRDIYKEELLLIGYGLVGEEASKILQSRNIDFAVYDKDYNAVKHLGNDILKFPYEIKNYRNILDFTNEGGWLKKDLLAEDALIATPGVPLSLEKEAKAHFEKNTVYDLLEIGTAVMLGLVIK
jgi:pyrrolysine biosynthesis protein PylD